LARIEVKPRRHGAAAAFDQQSLLHGGPDRRAKIDRGNRARRTSRRAVRLKRRNEGRTTEALGDAPCDQPEQASVPTFGAEEEKRPVGIVRKCSFGMSEGFLEHPLL